jgi:ferrous iron transport protein A
VTVKKLAPLGDPMEIQVRGYLLTIRKAEARMIDVELSHEEADQ